MTGLGIIALILGVSTGICSIAVLMWIVWQLIIRK